MKQNNAHIKKMQAGRRIAYLKKCILVLSLLEKHETATSVRKRVFEVNIQPVAMCSYSTFNNMLNEPNPQKQLETLLKL